MKDQIVNAVSEGDVKELLYDGDLVLFGDNKKLEKSKKKIYMVEKSYDEKGFEKKCVKKEVFLYWQKKCSNKSF